jgi:hypothetical protein
LRKPQPQQQRPKPKSDATFWRDGEVNERAFWGAPQAWWWRLAGWKKTAAYLLAVLLTWGFITHRTATEWLLALTLGPAAGIAAVRGLRAIVRWEHNRTKVRPLHWALVPRLGLPQSAKPADYLTVPVDYATDLDTEVVIGVGPDFTGEARELEDITRTVSVKLGIPNPQVTPRLGGREPCLIYRHAIPPPEGVSLAAIRPRIDAVKPSVAVLGLAAKNEFVELDLDDETPHGGVSMSTGLGKSEIAKNVAANVLFHGGIVMILDYKLVSHMWADGLPNVCYARTPAEIHEALLWLGWDECDADGNVLRPSELTRRKEVILAATRNREHANLTRLLIIAEERNATTRILKRHWRRIGGKGVSPALEALDETGETGRQICVNVLHIAQRLSAKASGSDGSRDAMENIGAIITKDPTEQTWKLLAGGHTQPPRSGHPGRYQLIRSQGVTEYQGVLYSRDKDESDAMARELAMAGTVGEPRSDMPFVWGFRPAVPAAIGQTDLARQEDSDQGFVIAQEAPVLRSGDGPARGVTLAEAVAAGLFVSLPAARRARSRKGWTPVVEDPVNGHQYAVADLATYRKRGSR